MGILIIVIVGGIIAIMVGMFIVVGGIIITPCVIITIIVRVFFISPSAFVSPSCERFIFFVGGIAASVLLRFHRHLIVRLPLSTMRNRTTRVAG